MSPEQSGQLDQHRLAPLRDRVVAVIGYGNQGRAHALNLRDSGVNVIVGSRPEARGATAARGDGFEARSISAAAAQGDLVIIALPDEAQPDVWSGEIEAHLKGGAIVGFLHGFSIRYERIKPAAERGVVMVAPKGPGTTLRQRYVEGRGILCLKAVHQQSPRGDAEAIALAWAEGIGCGRAGIIQTTFAEETESDLFGEQSVLCGGLTWLILAAFETLVDAGYDPKTAYIECCHEVKQIADLVFSRGIVGMMNAISTTAEFGAHTAGPAIVGDEVRRHMKQLLSDVRSGRFADQLRDDHVQAFRWLKERRTSLADHPIERAGGDVRAMMPWLNDPGSAT